MFLKAAGDMVIDCIAIGKRITKKRYKYGLTQRQLSELVHISDRHMSSLDYLVLGVPESEVVVLSNELYKKISDFTDDQVELLKLFIEALESK